jgi:hypothetical protein
MLLGSPKFLPADLQYLSGCALSSLGVAPELVEVYQMPG